MKRLREVGREVTTLTFVTPHSIGKFDLVEEDLSKELDVLLRIRERGFIRTYVNQSPRQQDNFKSHLGHYLAYLQNLGATQLPTKSKFVSDPSIVVFLRQEVENDPTARDLIEATADALILWALQGTDPDAGIMMNIGEIQEAIRGALPTASSFLPKEIVASRLQSLSTKKDGRRQVNHHRNDDRYVLPFKTRKTLEAEHAEDEALSLRMRAKLQERASASNLNLDPKIVADTALTAIHLAFESRGLEFAAFLEGRSSDPSSERTADLREPLHAAVTKS